MPWDSRIQFLIIVSGLQICISYGIKTTSYRKLNIQSDDTNIQRTEFSSFAKLKCASKCSEDIACLSFLHNSRNDSCKVLYGVLLTDSTIGPTSDNYYQKTGPEVDCRQAGFIYSLDYQVCYLIDKSWIDYPKSKTFCEQRGSTLIRVDSLNKQEFLQNVFMPDGVTKYIYIDGTRDVNGKWWFSNGTEITTFYWAPNEPDTAIDYFDCLMASPSNTLLWFNNKCYQYGETARICEKKV